jgi:hypothetical protein
MDEQAGLTLFGRLMVRDELLMYLRGRLRIEATYARHPEIEDEVVDRPVFVVGLPRSGTSILFELLAADPRFGALLGWESNEPCPPPEAATRASDPRIARDEHRWQRLNRLSSAFKTMHEVGALVPNECTNAFMFSFTTHNVASRCDVPDYSAYLATAADWPATYRYHRRLLKLLQWKSPRQRWLLKAPPHMWHLETLFEAFPDAQVIHTHRDPLRTMASGASLLATIRAMRSDKPFDAAGVDKMLKPEATAAGLNKVIDQMEAGTLPSGQIFPSLYADLMRDPVSALCRLYGRMGLAFDAATETRIRRFLDAKPKGKFGAHRYATSDDPAVRALFRRYQQYFGVEDE